MDSGFSVAAPQTLGRDLEELCVTSFQWAWPPGSLPCSPLCSGPLNVEIWMHTEIKAICCVAKKKKKEIQVREPKIRSD